MSNDTGDRRPPNRHSQEAAVRAARHDAHWRRTFGSRPYTDESRGYEHYRPAYQLGWEARERHRGRSFEESEPELRQSWDAEAKQLQWEEARPAVRDAFLRDDDDDATEASTPGNPLA